MYAVSFFVNASMENIYIYIYIYIIIYICIKYIIYKFQNVCC